MNTKKFTLFALANCFMLVSVSNSFYEVEETFKGIKGVQRYLVEHDGMKYRYDVDHRHLSCLDMECEIEKRNYEM